MALRYIEAIVMARYDGGVVLMSSQRLE